MEVQKVTQLLALLRMEAVDKLITTPVAAPVEEVIALRSRVSTLDWIIDMIGKPGFADMQAQFKKE